MAPLLVPAKGPKEANDFKAYLLQLRQELGKRLANRLYIEDGGARVVDFILWMNFNKRKFMSLKYQ